MTRIRTTILSVERYGTSVNGNPSYTLECPEGARYITATDAGIGYAATNFSPPHGVYGTPVVLTLTRAGRVTNIEHDVTGDLSTTARRGFMITVKDHPAIDGPPALFIDGPGGKRAWKDEHRLLAAQAFTTTRGQVRRVLQREYSDEHGRQRVSSWWYGPTSATDLLTSL